jgi:hypothetical protein
MDSQLAPRNAVQESAAVGLAIHTGWAHAVVVVLRENALVIVHKERIAFWDPLRHGDAHFYHRAADIAFETAESMIAADEQHARRIAAESLRSLAEGLASRDFRLVVARVADKVRKPLPSLAKILASHALIHAAEGALFRSIALTELGKLVDDAAEMDSAILPATLSGTAHLTPRSVTAQLDHAGKLSGPPWTQEHRACAQAAWLALLQHQSATS